MFVIMLGMLESVRQLAERYRQLHPLMQSNRQWSDQFSQAIASLTLAEVMLQKASDQENQLRHIVIMGPTQSGKSTLTNALLPEPLAEASALAGFTVHPQAFYDDQSNDLQDTLQTYFPGYTFQDIGALSRENVKELGLKQFEQNNPFESNTVLWDSPDFDSVDAAGYSDSVLRTIAMSDVLVLIVSKEKYADQRVWNMLELIEPLGKKLIVCINKTRESDSEIVRNSFEQRYREVFRGKKPDAILTLPYVEQENLPVDQLKRAIQQALITPIEIEPGTQQFIELHKATWLAPLDHERVSQQAWQERFDHEQELLGKRYRQDYLDHPHYYDTFQRALAELLNLLEVPGVGGKLAQAREVITWPVRTLLKSGKGLLNRKTKHSGKDQSYEASLIQQLADHLITRLVDINLQQAQDDQPAMIWQQDLARELNQSRGAILINLAEAVEEYQADFENEIQLAADRLYEQLQDQPALLNGLRAARVSVDAAAVVFALKSGGISMNDFVLAPAMLSLSSMLMESSLGQYLNKVKAELKLLQQEEVEKLIETHVLDELEQIHKKVMTEKAFNIDVSFGERKK